jgi:hypothetical protein
VGTTSHALSRYEGATHEDVTDRDGRVPKTLLDFTPRLPHFFLLFTIINANSLDESPINGHHSPQSSKSIDLPIGIR